MHAANSYVIRMATDGDEEDLARLAALDSSPPLEGSIIRRRARRRACRRALAGR